MTETKAQEKRYWTREEIGREASGLIRTQDALEKALSEIEALPSRDKDLVGDAAVSDADLEALQGILERVRSECDRVCEYGDDPGDDPLDDGTIGYDYFGPSWPMRDI